MIINIDMHSLVIAVNKRTSTWTYLLNLEDYSFPSLTMYQGVVEFIAFTNPKQASFTLSRYIYYYGRISGLIFLLFVS